LQVPSNNQSTYLAGWLYYDLSERLLSRGQLLQVIIFSLINLLWWKISSYYEICLTVELLYSLAPCNQNNSLFCFAGHFIWKRSPPIAQEAPKKEVQI
jgi:hypothetical protein